MIDTHCHLTYEPLCERIEQVLVHAAQAGVDRMITVGTSPADVGQAVELSQRYEGIYASVGVHPHHVAECGDRGAIGALLHELTVHPRVVALGEMGLDKHYRDPPLVDQRRVLQWQLEVAAVLPEAGPIIIHNREATGEVLDLLRDSGIDGQRFVFHCFTGTDDELDAVLDFGAMVSFTGIVTFASARDLAATARRVPLDRLMVETDSPYLTPEPHRRTRPNEPCYVPCVARFLAQDRGVDERVFFETMDANAQCFFRLP